MPKMKKGQTKAECGCTCDATRWLILCETHQAECNGVHRRWNEERLARALPPMPHLAAVKIPESAVGAEELK